jgi:hypothetical protein
MCQYIFDMFVLEVCKVPTGTVLYIWNHGTCTGDIHVLFRGMLFVHVFHNTERINSCIQQMCFSVCSI